MATRLAIILVGLASCCLVSTEYLTYVYFTNFICTEINILLSRLFVIKKVLKQISVIENSFVIESFTNKS